MAWNHALADFKAGLDAGEFWNDRKLRPRFNAVKASAWNSELSQNAAKNAIINLGRAAWRGKTKGGASRKRKNRFPRFKKKGLRDSFRADNGRGTVKVRGAAVAKDRLAGARSCVSPATWRASPCKAGRWFAAVTVETGDDPPTKRGGATVDVGVKTLAVCSDGIAYSNPKPLKRSLGRLARLQRRKARGRFEAQQASQGADRETAQADSRHESGRAPQGHYGDSQA